MKKGKRHNLYSVFKICEKKEGKEGFLSKKVDRRPGDIEYSPVQTQQGVIRWIIKR
jgi:hypothetical protein